METNNTERKRITVDLEIDTTIKSNHDNPYKKFIYISEVIDSYRIFPRIFLTLYMYLSWWVVDWFTALENPTMEQSGLVSILIGSAAAWFGLYVNKGVRSKEKEKEKE